MIDEELVRLIRATIQDELRTSRIKVPELAGGGGNTVISSRGDIILTPGVGRHAYYQKDTGRVELGTGTGGSGTIGGSGTAGYIPLFTPDGLTLGNSLLSQSGTIISSAATINMTIGKAIQIYDVDSHLDGYIIGLISNNQELPNNIGIEIVGKQHSGVTVGSFFAGDSNGSTIMGISGSTGYGVHITEVGVGISPGANKDIQLITSGTGKAYYNGVEIAAGGAPTDATYIVQTASGGLSAEQALGALGTGILKNTTTTGVLSIAVAADIPDLSTLYLPIGGGTLTGDLIIAKSNPLLTIKATSASSPVLDFRDSSNNVDAQLYTTTGNDAVLVCTSGGLYLATAATTGGSIYLETKDVTRLTIADVLITSTVELAMGSHNISGLSAGVTDDEAVNVLQMNTALSSYMPYSGGSFTGSIWPGTDNTYDLGDTTHYWQDVFGIKYYVGASDIWMAYSAGGIVMATGSVTRLTIDDTVITAAVPIAMGSNAITTSSTVDGIDISAHAADVTTLHLPSQATHSGKFLTTNGSVASWGAVSWNGGTVTGDITINKSLPALYFDNTTQKGQIYHDNTNFRVESVAGSLLLGSNSTTRLTIADALITSTVAMKTVAMYPTVDNTSDLGTSTYYYKDVYSKGKYIVGATDVYITISGGNMDLCTNSTWKASVTDTSFDLNAIPLKLATGVTIENNAGSMKFTVPTGEVFEFVVS